MSETVLRSWSECGATADWYSGAYALLSWARGRKRAKARERRQSGPLIKTMLQKASSLGFASDKRDPLLTFRRQTAKVSVRALEKTLIVEESEVVPEAEAVFR